MNALFVCMCVLQAGLGGRRSRLFDHAKLTPPFIHPFKPCPHPHKNPTPRQPQGGGGAGGPGPGGARGADAAPEREEDAVRLPQRPLRRQGQGNRLAEPGAGGHHHQHALRRAARGAEPDHHGVERDGVAHGAPPHPGRLVGALGCVVGSVNSFNSFIQDRVDG